MSEKTIFKVLFLRKNEAGKSGTYSMSSWENIGEKRSVKNQSAKSQKRDLPFFTSRFRLLLKVFFTHSFKRFFP